MNKKCIDHRLGYLEVVNDYVPNGLIPGEYGDYIDLNIDVDGTIANWSSVPNVDEVFEELDE